MIKTNKSKVIFLKEENADGKGKYTYSDGESYEGEWKDGKYHGKGNYTSIDGDALEGKWKDGNLVNHGKYTSSDGTMYLRDFKD